MQRCWFALAVLSFGACGNDKMHTRVDASIDGPPAPPWWQPKPGETKNWDIQINGPFDFTADRDMMIVDLWSSVPSEMPIDYGDGAPVTVPAGANASVIATLKARDTVVVCRVGLGGVKTSDPDFAKFPAAALSAMALDDDGVTHYLDFVQRDTWEAFAFARIDLAKQMGCDAIEPYLSDHGNNDLGFTPDLELQRSWYVAVASEVHDRELSAGMRNGVDLGLVDDQVTKFDWLLVERCAEPPANCDGVRAFRNMQKAAFAIDYQTDFGGTPQDPVELCMEQRTGNVEDGIVKDVALSSAFRLQCE